MNTIKTDKPLGVYYEMEESYYHSIPAFNFSGAKEFAKSPAHYQEYLKKEWTPDPDREKYKAVHLLCLEPQEEKRIIIKDGRWAGALKNEVIELAKQGNIVLKLADYEEAKAITKRFHENKSVSTLLANCKSEVSLFWNDVDTGVYCKARVDIMNPELGHIIDLKNFGDLSNQWLVNLQINKGKYHYQQAHYSSGYRHCFDKGQVTLNKWIFIEDKAPYGIRIVNCPDVVFMEGHNKMLSLLKKFKLCQESGTWSSYDNEEFEAELPKREQITELEF